MSRAEVVAAAEMLQSHAGGCGKGEIPRLNAEALPLWRFYCPTTDSSPFVRGGLPTPGPQI